MVSQKPIVETPSSDNKAVVDMPLHKMKGKPFCLDQKWWNNLFKFLFLLHVSSLRLL